MARHTKLVEVTTLLEHLDLLKGLGKVGDKFEAVRLHEKVVDQGVHPDVALVQSSLQVQV